MKFEVKKRGSKEFYDEMLYVITYYKKFVKKPNKKAWQYTEYICLFVVLSLLMCGAFVALYLIDKEWYSMVMVGAFILTLLFSLMLLVTVKKRIKAYMNDTGVKTIEIIDESISYSSDTMNLKMKKTDIAVIVINKYSICILPKEANQYAISISMDYLDDFLSGVKEYGYENLIVDNRKK